MDGLRSIQQVLTELVAQIHIDFIKAALVITESCEMLIDVLPLAVLLVCFLLEVGKEVALHLLLVKEVIPFIDYGLITAAAKGFCLLSHTVVVVTFTLVLRLGIDIDAERFMAHDLHGGLIPIARIIVQIEGQLISALDFPCAECHGLADVTHSFYLFIVLLS